MAAKAKISVYAAKASRESGQAMVEAALLCLLLAFTAGAGLELAAYVYAASAADAACTEAVRAVQAEPDATDADVLAAAQRAAGNAGEVTCAVTRGADDVESYTHHVPDGQGGWTDRESRVTTAECTAKASVTRAPVTSIGKAIGLVATGSGIYTLESERTFQVDKTAEAGTW